MAFDIDYDVEIALGSSIGAGLTYAIDPDLSGFIHAGRD